MGDISQWGVHLRGGRGGLEVRECSKGWVVMEGGGGGVMACNAQREHAHSEDSLQMAGKL